MNVFITGGTGFIGSHLADYLLRSPDIRIRCLIRSEEKWLHDKDIIKVQGTLQDLAALESGIAGADLVYHIAGLVRAPRQHLFDKVQVEATENVLRLAMKHKVPRMVVLSSLAACGPSTHGPLNESDPLKPVTMYGKSKKRMEEMIHRVADNNMAIRIIRPPAVYGPREDQIFSVFQMASWRLFPIIGNGDARQVSLVHVNDLIEGILLAAEQAKPGIETYFIGSETFYSWNQIHQATQKVMGKKIFGLRISPRFMQRAGTVIEKTVSLTGAYPVINREKAVELGLPWACSVNKARKELGFRQKTGLEEGLRQTIHWYKKHFWL